MKRKTENHERAKAAVYLGGSPSAAMLAKLFLDGDRPDVIVMPDPGAETAPSMRYLYDLGDWLRKKRFPALTVVTADTTIEQHCQKRAEFPDPPACSDKFRRRPVEKFLDAKYGPDGYTVLFPTPPGLEYSPRTVINRVGAWRCRFPLSGLSETEFRAIMDKAGMPESPPGGCFLCPLSTAGEVRRLTEQQASRAVALEVLTKNRLGGTWPWSGVINGKIDVPDVPRPAPDWCRHGHRG